VYQQPVALDILFVLYQQAQNNKTGLHVNAIFNELVANNRIAKNKNRVIEALNDLKQSGLIETTMSGKQKEIKKLKPLGYEFVKLTIDIDKHVNTCSELLNLILDILVVEKYSDEKVQRSMLQQRGWFSEEIDEREMIFQTAKSLEYLVSPYEIMSVVLTRYISILSRIKNNETAKIILNQIMMERINDLLSNTIIKKGDKELKWPEDGYKYLINQKTDKVADHFDNHYYYNRFTDMKVVDMLKSLMDVLDVRDYDIARLIGFISERERRKDSRRSGSKI
jgi:hypothetical protein